MVCMTKLESILEQAKSLSPPELEELMKVLSADVEKKQASDATPAKNGKPRGLPLIKGSVIGSLRRRDLYDTSF
jgi:hypothetical protein